MREKQMRKRILRELDRNGGLLPTKPCWVARSFLPPGRRLGLSEAEYDAGERGSICERWIVSETEVKNAVVLPHEGQSWIRTSDDTPILLADALDVCRDELLGADYARRHTSLDRLLKIYDYETRLFFHIHQRKQDAAKVGMNSKEEAYYYLDADPGKHPETYFGVHPYIVDGGRQKEFFLPYLKQWQGESILRHSRAYLNAEGEGFHLAPGILHAPGTALTLELQESSDIMAILQAEVDGLKIDKALLFQHLPQDAVAEEAAVLDQIDWEACADPYFYENHHLAPLAIAGEVPEGVAEEWVWYNSTRFSGTRITLQPGRKYVSTGLGVHGLFVWKGAGFVDDFPVEGQKVSLTEAADEFLVVHDKALKGVGLRNTGSIPMVVFKFFGPEINDSIVPSIKPVLRSPRH
ncbi:MAG: hypothetical protein P4M05_25275 [Bradyrhizobium sp.]|nr:hypothetical protein [Bradyrhizobium sp.]